MSPARIDRRDAGRSGLPTHEAVEGNGKGIPVVAQLDPIRLMKIVIDLGGSIQVCEIDLRVLDATPSANSSLTAVGLAEVELRLCGR